MTSQTCCSDSAHAFQGLAQELQEAAADPTLASCCQRDLEEQAQVAKLKARLTAVDRSNVRGQVAQAVLRRTPPAASPPQGADEDEASLSGSEDEAIVARLRAVRLEELQRHKAEKERLQAAGHGTLTTVPAARLLETATSSAGPLVCHIVAEGCEACDALDEHLATLAFRFPGTRFMRTLAQLAGRQLLKLLALTGPGLACFRKGALVGSAALEVFADEEAGLLEERVTLWLQQQQVLREEGARATAAGDAAVAARDDSSDEGQGTEADSWQPACEVCGRRYPHQHIRSTFVSRGSDSSDEDGVS